MNMNIKDRADRIAKAMAKKGNAPAIATVAENKNASLKSILKELYEQEEIPASEESPSQIVAKAIDNTDPAYMERSLAQRTPGPAAAGSTFKSPQTIESLKSAIWGPLTHNPESITSPAIAYEANIPGLLGAADVNEYPDDMQVVIQPAHGGKGIHRQSGKLMAEIVGVLPGGQPTVDFTTIILGPTQSDPKKMQVYTFHPGAPAAQGTPIFLEDMKTKFDTESDKIKISLGEAKKIGFITIKHVNELPAVEETTATSSPEAAAPAASIQEGFTSARWQRLANIIKG